MYIYSKCHDTPFFISFRGGDKYMYDKYMYGTTYVHKVQVDSLGKRKKKTVPQAFQKHMINFNKKLQSHKK